MIEKYSTLITNVVIKIKINIFNMQKKIVKHAAAFLIKTIKSMMRRRISRKTESRNQ